MLYIDDEARHDFHQTPALLQVICSILDTYMAEGQAQPQVIDVKKHQGMWIAMIDVPDAEAEVFEATVEKLNKAFQRKDESDTCVIENFEARLITVRVTEPSDFLQPH